jgi:hypothetical protein
MESVKGRHVSPGDWVHIYRNLNRDKSLSIRSKKTGLVVGYCQNVQLEDATFHVSAKGRAAVLQKQIRSVLAWIEARLVSVDLDVADVQGQICVYYNPYNTETFM